MLGSGLITQRRRNPSVSVGVDRDHSDFSQFGLPGEYDLGCLAVSDSKFESSGSPPVRVETTLAPRR